MLSLIIIALILAIAFFQAVHGLFSSLIMALCTLVCTLLAFNLYEPLASLFGLYDRIPAYADGVLLVALLVVPLFVIRFLVDNYLPGNVVPSMWVDRAGGAAFGLVTALLLVGTMVVALQMLPFDREILGYDPYDDSLEPKDSLIIDAPGFTLGLVERLSAGSMGAGKPFSDVHPNLTLELWGWRNRQSGARNDTVPGELAVKHVSEVTDLPLPDGDDRPEDRFRVRAPQYPGVDVAASRVYVVRVEVGEQARDPDNWWRLRGTQFRLVTADGRGYFPVGYLVRTGDWQVLSDPIGELQVSREWSRGADRLTADWVFRVPEAADPAGREPATLSHVEFRRVCRQAVPNLRTPETLAALPTENALGRRATYGEVAVSARGLQHLFRPRRAVVNADLPAGFARRTGAAAPDGRSRVQLSVGGARVDATVMNDQLQSGTVIGPAEQLWRLAGTREGDAVPVTRLIQPQGMRLVKLHGTPLSGASLATGALGAAQRLDPSVIVQAQVFVAGQPPRPASGAWVTWNEGGEQHVHYFYNAQPREFEEFLAHPEPRLIDVIRTYYDKRDNVTEVGLMFLVSADAVVTGFRTASADRATCESPLSVGQPPRQPYRRR